MVESSTYKIFLNKIKLNTTVIIILFIFCCGIGVSSLYGTPMDLLNTEEVKAKKDQQKKKTEALAPPMIGIKKEVFVTYGPEKTVKDNKKSIPQKQKAPLIGQKEVVETKILNHSKKAASKSETDYANSIQAIEKRLVRDKK